MLSTLVLCDSGLSLYLRALAVSDNGALIFNYAVGVARSHSLYVNALFMVIRNFFTSGGNIHTANTDAITINNKFIYYMCRIVDFYVV